MTLEKEIRKLASHKGFSKLSTHVKWCTPSTFPEVIENYKSDMEGSVSISLPGKLQNNTGVFEKVNAEAAIAYKNGQGHSHFGCEGTTGANRVLFDFIGNIFSEYGGNSHVLSARNVHQSIVVNAEKNRVPINYINTRSNQVMGIFMPPKKEDFLNRIDKDTKVVMLTNPTYEGNSTDLKDVIGSINEINPDILIYIDEAWGAHLAFNERLPSSAIELGADIVVQSIHKHGGGINPMNITHLSKRMKENFMKEYLRSYEDNTSTSPSYPLIHAMDITRHIMQNEGKGRIDSLISLASGLAGGISQIDGFDLMIPNGGIHSYDLTKVNVDVRKSGLTGDHIAERLEREYGIITEKEEIGSLTFLATFGMTNRDVEYTLESLRGIMSSARRNGTVYQYASLPEEIEKVYNTFDAKRMPKKQIRLEDSVGQILGENIKCYPPGIYVCQTGERVNEELKDYLMSIRGRAHVCAMDKTLETLKVLR